MKEKYNLNTLPSTHEVSNSHVFQALVQCAIVHIKRRHQRIFDFLLILFDNFLFKENVELDDSSSADTMNTSGIPGLADGAGSDGIPGRLWAYDSWNNIFH